jgi:hypothetical protein
VFVSTTAYFPPLRWLRLAASAGQWQWEAHENYQKGGWRNRCRILTANGPQLLSIPLAGGKHQQMPIREVRIDNSRNWRRVHEQTIRSAYGRAPFFDFYADGVFAALHQPEQRLWHYNRQLLLSCLNLLQLDIELSESQRFLGADAGAVPTEIEEKYPQVFADRFGFVDGLSVLDGLFCLGPGIT